MRRMDDEIQMLLKEYGGDIDQALAQNSRLDYLYALSEQRELLLEWYDFDQSEELLQVGADYGAMTGLYRSVVRNVTVLDTEKKALETVQLRYPAAKNITCEQGTLSQYRDRMAGTGKKYQYIVMTGMPEETWDSQICAAKALLKDTGVLIVAVANALGMKYWAGSGREEGELAKGRLVRLLCGDSKEQGHLCFYYPMPDYRVPVSIYSDEYLPKKGDLTRVTPAYDYPQYHMMDMGEGFDAVCEEGLFDLYANSYLVFWSLDSKELEKNQRIFIKYNKTRREQFQIKTCICQKKRQEPNPKGDGL